MPAPGARVLRALAVVAAAVPWAALRALGGALGWLAGSVLRIRRSHVGAAMAAAGVAESDAEARAMYGALGTSAFELLRVARRPEEVRARVAFDAASGVRWRDAAARGRGLVLAASHTGNWDLAACRVALETELLVVTKRLSMRGIDAFWQSTRTALGVALTEGQGAMARGRAVLARGGAVAMMIDQVPDTARQAVSAEFLGRSAFVDRAAAALAASTGAPLLVTASRRLADGTHVLLVLDVLLPPDRPSLQWIRDATVSATAALDGFVRTHPSQWLWLHRRWRPLDRRRGGGMLGPQCPQEVTRSSSPAGASTVA